MADWYYARDGQQYGPITSQQLKQLAHAGQLLPDDLVFREGSKDWVAASTVQGLFPASTAKPAAVRATSPPAQAGAFAFEESRPAGQESPFATEEDDSPRTRRAGGIGDLLMFKRMITPTIVMVLFWLGVAGSVVAGLGLAIRGLMFGGMMGIMMALAGLVFIPLQILLVRLWCEMVIVVFRIHETLTDIRDLQKKQSQR